MSPTGTSTSRKTSGTLALLGGDEWTDECRSLDAELLAASGGDEVVVLPTAAAYEQPDRVVERAAAWFETLGARVCALRILNRRDAETDAHLRSVRAAKLLYICDGSPLHLRSVLKGSPLWDAIVSAYRDGAVLAASGAGATVVCDPMVDPRGGAYTVGLGVVSNLAVFPYHGTAARHLRERSVQLLPRGATLAGLDETTALVRSPAGEWRAIGPGSVTLYRGSTAPEVYSGEAVPNL
ncbi:MAG: Type 1 glutamine amidotransferase-like domain-containing protein [Acidimicrobiia bacterium]|nr:Type 1 glutamine amidotransferase-like domain-containing protein [Acidimicrobiia bacterium]